MRENAEEPFYVNIWGHSTHFPVNPTPELAAEFSEIEVNREDFSETMQHKFDESAELDADLDESMRQYMGDVYSIDLNVGRVLRAIDELGIREETIVVFSSDHGPAPVVVASKGPREFSKNMLGYAGEFRGGKHTQLEGGTRVPMIIRWLGHVEAGRVDTENVTSFIDWMPTVCAIAGIDKLPKRLDGENVSDLWFGADRKRCKPLYWKVSAPRAAPAMREGKWKLHVGSRRGGEIELYDLSVDPSESRNVAKEHPEVVAGMSAKLEAWVAELPEEYEKVKQRRK